MTYLPTGRNHRTALVIDVRNGVTPDFTERYKRLLESVNGDNIKVDVYTLRSSNSSAGGPSLVRGTPDNNSSAPPAPEIDLAAWAAEQGYDQLLISSSPQS